MSQPVMVKAIIISLSGRRKGIVFLALARADLRRPIAYDCKCGEEYPKYCTLHLKHPPKAPEASTTLRDLT